MGQTSLRQTKWLVQRRAIVVAALIAGTSLGMLCSRDASSEPMVADGAPSGMVTFVGGGVCPPGWVHMSEVEGRTIVGTVIKEDVGIEIGTPLGDREVPLHHHDYTVDINLPAKFIFGATGPNPTAAGAKLYSVTDVTDENASELPFFQMEACVKP